MPAPVVVVHDKAETRWAIEHALRDGGLEVAAFADPMTALDAIQKDSRVRVLVTRVSFGPDKLNGLALFRMLDHKRILLGASGTLRPVFIGRASYQQDAEDVGEFLPTPADPQKVVKVVRKLL